MIDSKCESKTEKWGTQRRSRAMNEVCLVIQGPRTHPNISELTQRPLLQLVGYCLGMKRVMGIEPIGSLRQINALGAIG